MNLIHKATELRIETLKMIEKAKSGHLGSDFSCADIITALYYGVLNVDPKNPSDPDRDRYIQSKGHAVEILWATLADKGFFDREYLETYSQYNTPLIGHPNNKMPGIEMNTGSLGHGLAISVGSALAAKMDNKSYRTFTLLGDGELAEGSVWEAAMAAAHFKLNNLTAIIDYNQLQISGKTSEVMSNGPIENKWEAFGWDVVVAQDGNDVYKLVEILNAENNTDKPRMVVAYTTKGKGISDAENKADWHHKVPNDEQYEKALTELRGLLHE